MGSTRPLVALAAEDHEPITVRPDPTLAPRLPEVRNLRATYHLRQGWWATGAERVARMVARRLVHDGRALGMRW